MKKSFLPALLLAALTASSATATHAASLYFDTLAGSAGTVVNSIDGAGSAAQFNAPRGVALDGSGNLYIADSANHTIRKVTSAGIVTTLAGTAGTQGKNDGTGTAATFNEPFALAVDSSGNVFVADTNSNAIRKITPAGVVTTLAGGAGKGSSDGTSTAAKFSEPRGIAIDAAGNLYVADYENHTVRKVTPSGVVTTLAGTAGSSGNTDGQGAAARFQALQGITVDSAGNIYVTEQANRSVRKITPAGLVTTLASGASAFGEPRGIAIDAGGNLFIADYTAHVVRKVTAAGVVSTYAGTAPTPGSTDGPTSSALFYAPNGVAVDNAGNLYVADTLNNTVRKISSTGAVTTLAGLAGRSSSVDGVASAARFEDPYAIAVDSSGNTYVADATDHSIRKIAAGGTVTTLAGKAGSFGSTDATGSAARFKGPLGIAVDSVGNVYVADTGNLTVRKITAAGVVSTLAGSAGQSGSTDGTGSAARFSSPYGIAVDGSGNLYVVESTGVVRKITAAGVVSTLAGGTGNNGFTNGTGSAARFSVPFDIAVDGSGNLYVSDHGNHAVRKITPSGVVTTLAGSGTAGNTNGTGTAASFHYPSGIAADSAGNVYLADTDNQVIRKISAAGVVTTVGGGSIGSTDGTGSAARFYNPKDVAVDAAGNLYITDRGNHTIRKGSPLDAPNVVSDCLLDWAERAYPGFFAPAGGASQLISVYYFRYYAGNSAYLAVDTSSDHLVYLGSLSQNQLLDLGSVNAFVAGAGCQ
jgi:sugar lactone lactonase YvrE